MAETDLPRIPSDFLLALARNYENGNRNWCDFKVETAAEKNLIADLKANKLIEALHGEIQIGKHVACRFTDDGYRKYKPRIDAEGIIKIP
ncbi:MAG: hypothetical protein A3J28_00445 [Acidobacteria bacterium RIFCSPLOWO2_12_FULL_60_22]|nr:MAG: hypothetical protein A3J28_00445 [Acidobacteria bacterium RIFCSPLOWO2_12_FULL_60_22]